MSSLTRPTPYPRLHPSITKCPFDCPVPVRSDPEQSSIDPRFILRCSNFPNFLSSLYQTKCNNFLVRSTSRLHSPLTVAPPSPLVVIYDVRPIPRLTVSGYPESLIFLGVLGTLFSGCNTFLVSVHPVVSSCTPTGWMFDLSWHLVVSCQ